MTFTPTDEQLSIIAAATNSSDNLLISALAGAAKTSTLILIAEALSTTQILALCFNKKIATEMQQRLPSNCTCKTLNSLGHSVWGQALGKRLILDADKNYKILSTLVEDLSPGERKELDDSFAEVLRLIAFGKSCGYVPTDHFPRAKRLMEDEEFFSHVEQKLNPLQCDLVRRATIQSITLAMQGTIDFDDQVFMPTIFHGYFPSYPLVLIDEAQDLSALNHAMLQKMVRKRIIAVGDERQAIYGFRGAHEDSMKKLRKQFSMRELILSVSFRCPRRIVEHAQWRAPHMKWWDKNEGGEVSHADFWSAGDLASSAAILCRNNAPLFSLAVKLLTAGRACELANKDVAKSLAKIMLKFGPRHMSQSDVIDKIAQWATREKHKMRKSAHGGIDDRAACMKVFARQGETLGDAIAYANHLAGTSGPLKLMTIHKAKGLEFSTVYILDNEIIKDEGQDPNLRYVAQTRAMERLIYINSDMFVEKEAVE